jgi:hypothetical protein
MNTTSRALAAAILATGMAATALAQGQAPAAEDHDAHHPEAAGPAPQPVLPSGPATPGATRPGGMMGPGMTGSGMMGEMGRMMQMMTQMQGMPMQGGMGPGAARDGTDFAMRPFRRMEGQLAYYRTELRITEAQAPRWNAFADAVRTQSDRLRQAVMQAMQSAAQPATAPQQIERRIALLSAQIEAMRAVGTAAGPLYAALSEEQRRTADELMAEHFRGMRMGMF